jgi:enoyl-CoA hydratase/carnithine racemase
MTETDLGTTGLEVARDGAVLRLTLNRPERLNAVNADLLNAAAAVVEKSASDDTIRVVVVAGAGRAFCSGADLVALSSSSEQKSSEDVRSDQTASAVDSGTLAAANRLILALRQVPKPVLAAVNGLAVGVGCSIVLACDLAVASESAYLLLAFAKVGLMPDGGATWTVPAAVGRMRAARMAMLAERIPATTAAEWGLISHVVPDDAFDAAVADHTRYLAEGPTLAFALTKQAFALSESAHLAAALEAELVGQAACLSSPDFAEGLSAFKQKRPPQFSGN